MLDCLQVLNKLSLGRLLVNWVVDKRESLSWLPLFSIWIRNAAMNVRYLEGCVICQKANWEDWVSCLSDAEEKVILLSFGQKGRHFYRLCPLSPVWSCKSVSFGSKSNSMFLILKSFPVSGVQGKCDVQHQWRQSRSGAYLTMAVKHQRWLNS